jgi:hypothetical protein
MKQNHPAMRGAKDYAADPAMCEVAAHFPQPAAE